MHRSTTGEVETTHDINPSVRVPGPASDRIVDDRGPYEHEDHAR